MSGRAGKRGGGARQPLSQQRPGAARKAGSAAKVGGRKVGAAGKANGAGREKGGTAGGASAKGKAAKRGGPPPKAKIAPRTAARTTKSSPPGSSHRSSKSLGGAGAWAGKPLDSYTAELIRRLTLQYPDAHCELDHVSPWQLIVATVLSAQTTDKRVNMVTPALFTRYPTPAALAAARQEDVEEIIKSTGFFRNKAKSIIGLANAVTDRFGGLVPATLPELVTLPGVGRKTGNVVLGNAFNINEGVVVDTHVGRLSRLLGLTSETDPEKVEADLMQLAPRDTWTLFSHLLIWHGRRVCDARNPRCPECSLADICPSARVP
ncbi:MAG: endonuclease III [Gemmatimonadaceae bacterium]